MAAILGGRLCGIVACTLALAACSSPDTGAGPNTSYEAAAINASQSGDQKTAIEMASKEVTRLSTSDPCSRETNRNCGTLALAYGSLAEYQILGGDKAAGESSFANARSALVWIDSANRPSATAMVYRDVSEAYWKVGDRDRAIAVFKEGRDSGGDGWLAMSSAAKAVASERQRPDDSPRVASREVLR